MLLNIKYSYIWFLCLCCTAICAGHVDGNKKNSKCQCDSELRDQVAQLRIELEELKQPVGFCVSDQANLVPGLDNTLIYNNVDMNVGGATYLADFGTFVAMDPGLYHCYVQFCNKATKAAVVGLKHNTEVLFTSTVNDAVESDCSTAATSVMLNHGDTMSVVAPHGSSEFYQNAFRTNRFCCHRITSFVMN